MDILIRDDWSITCQYTTAITNGLALMDDKVRFHQALLVEDYLENHGFERMEWLARSPNLNPIEHVWGYFGRNIVYLSPPPMLLHELKNCLL